MKLRLLAYQDLQRVEFLHHLLGCRPYWQQHQEGKHHDDNILLFRHFSFPYCFLLRFSATLHEQVEEST